MNLPLLVLSATAYGLGNSLDSISLFALLAPLLALEAADRLADDCGKVTFVSWLVFAVVQACGQVFGFAGSFKEDEDSSLFESVALCFLFGCVISAVLTLLVFLPSHILHRRLHISQGTILAFPCLQAAVNVVLGRVLSTFTSPPNALLDIRPLRQLGSVIGLCGIDFLACLAVSAVYHNAIFPGSTPKRHPAHLRSHTLAVACVIASALAFGGILLRSNSFYQRPTIEYLPRTIQASCVLGMRARNGTRAWENVMGNTQERVHAGDDLVLMSEEAFKVQSDEEEAALIQSIVDITSPANSSYVGLTYFKEVGPPGNYTNMFVLVQPNGDIAWSYQKSYPVPVVESDLLPGPGIIPVHDSHFGRLGGAICMDFDHPELIRSAGQNEVDVMLQPSWTWGGIGTRHFEGDSLRAIENGFTLIRCSTNGISGVISPLGFTWSRAMDSGEGLILWPNLPVPPRTFSVYPYIAVLIEAVLLLSAIALWVCAFASEEWVKSKLLKLVGEEEGDEEQKRPLLASKDAEA